MATKLDTSGPDESKEVAEAERKMNAFLKEFLRKRGEKIVAEVGRRLKDV